MHKSRRFLQEQPAVLGRRVVTRELDQVATVEKILEQQFLILGKGRSLGQGGEEFDRGLARHRQLILLGNVEPENVGDADAELVGRLSFYFTADPIEQFKCALARRGLRPRTLPPAADPPPDKTAEHQGDGRSAENYPRRQQRVINRRRDIVEFFGG